MSKFNKTTVRAASTGPVFTSGSPAFNHNGGIGTTRPVKSELFLAVISDFGGEATFYESAANRAERIRALVREAAVQDLEWLIGLTGWVRNEANLRSVAIMIALEGAKALNDAKIPGARKLVSSALLRADEPGEAFAYWFSKYGRTVPVAVKRGIADAAVKSYNEYSLAKYDTASKGFRFGDVLELAHVKPKDEKQSELFKFALDRRKNTSAEPGESLITLRNRASLLSLSKEELRKVVVSNTGEIALQSAGLTWEALAGAYGDGGLDAKAWEAIIPNMGYMALLRNLRNFEKAGVSDAVLTEVANRISDPEEVAKSRQLPFRFLAAHRAIVAPTSRYGQRLAPGSLRFAYPLERALNASLDNVPALDGNTLILVDRSGSMFGTLSEKTQLNRADSAAIFGSALAVRAKNATLAEFGTSFNEIPFQKSSSVLSLVNSFGHCGGTDTHEAVRRYYKGHDRVIILTDEQYSGGGRSYYGMRSASAPLDAVPANVPCYTWNLAGYRVGSGESTPTRTYLGGLSDQSFKLIPLLESGYSQTWPWEN